MKVTYTIYARANFLLCPVWVGEAKDSTSEWDEFVLIPRPYWLNWWFNWNMSMQQGLNWLISFVDEAACGFLVHGYKEVEEWDLEVEVEE